jgi:hypothetical protein
MSRNIDPLSPPTAGIFPFSHTCLDNPHIGCAACNPEPFMRRSSFSVILKDGPKRKCFMVHVKDGIVIHVHPFLLLPFIKRKRYAGINALEGKTVDHLFAWVRVNRGVIV